MSVFELEYIVIENGNWKLKISIYTSGVDKRTTSTATKSDSDRSEFTYAFCASAFFKCWTYRSQVNMKILRTVQQNFVYLGISCSNQLSINAQYVGTCLIYGVGITFSAIFLFREANSFQEYTDNLYITTSLVVGFCCITNIFLKVNELFQLIDKLEKTIEKSE